MRRMFLWLAAAAAAFTLSAADHQALLDALDLADPSLAEVAAAYRKGDRKTAEHLLAEHFRQRGADTSPITVKPDFDRGPADKVVAGTVSPAHITHTFPDAKIDWRYNPTKASGPYNPEFTWQLNRMPFWATLGEAYRATGDERYAQAFVEQLRSWCREVECPNAPTEFWRTLECGSRLKQSWPEAFRAMGNAPCVTDDDVLAYIERSYEQCRFLIRHHGTGNWLTMEMNGLFRFMATYPEFKESEKIRRFAVAVLATEFKKQFLPDGFQCELTTMYHNVAVGNSLEVVRTAQQCGCLELIPKELLDGIEKGYEALVVLRTPGDGIPLTNDSGPLTLKERYERLLPVYPENTLFRWIATGGKEGAPPAYTSAILPWAGYIAMRTGWEKSDKLLVFDVGMTGAGHIHQDKLNIILFAGRDELLFDDGGGSYERSKFRDHSTSAFAHNTCIVDGMGQQRDKGVPRAPVPCKFETTPEVDFAEAVYNEGFGPQMKRIAVHTRQITYLKPDIILILDRLVPRDGQKHDYELLFQTRKTDLQPVVAGHPGLKSLSQRGSDLILAPLLTRGLKVKKVSDDRETPAGVYFMKNGKVRPATTIKHLRSGKGPQTFLTLVMPVKQRTCPVTALEEKDQSAVIRFEDGRALRVTLPEAVGGRLRTEWIEGR